MSEITYTNLLNKTLELYAKEDYIGAYKYITENSKKVKCNLAQIYNFRYSLACKAGLLDLAMDLLKEAVLSKGYWYSYDYLIGNEDLIPLKFYDDFYYIIDKCKERELKEKSNSKPKIKIKNSNIQGSTEKLPLFLALHGNEENIEIVEDYWKASAMDKYLLALPQSSDIGFSNGYYWYDAVKGSKELKSHLEKIIKENNIDSNNIIIGGFSAGCKVLLHAILNNYIKPRGFIFLAPWLPELSNYINSMESLINVKGYILCGDKDIDCNLCTKEFINMLSEYKIPHMFRTIKDLNHDYPSNFSEYLNEGISFINND